MRKKGIWQAGDDLAFFAGHFPDRPTAIFTKYKIYKEGDFRKTGVLFCLPGGAVVFLRGASPTARRRFLLFAGCFFNSDAPVSLCLCY